MWDGGRHLPAIETDKAEVQGDEHVSKRGCGMLLKGVGGRYSLPTGGGSRPPLSVRLRVYVQYLKQSALGGVYPPQTSGTAK